MPESAPNDAGPSPQALDALSFPISKALNAPYASQSAKYLVSPICRQAPPSRLFAADSEHRSSVAGAPLSTAGAKSVPASGSLGSTPHLARAPGTLALLRANGVTSHPGGGPPNNRHKSRITFVRGANLMKAAIFHGANQPLTVEQVEVDEPQEHEVLVRDSGHRRVPQRSAFRRGLVAPSRARGAGPRGRRHRGKGRQVGHLPKARRPCDFVRVGVLRQLRSVPVGPSQSLRQRRRGRRPKDESRACRWAASRCSSLAAWRPSRKRCWCMRMRW